MKLKRIFAAVTAFALCASLAGCGAAATVSESAAESAVEATPAVTEAPATEETADASEAALRIAGLKGPTTMGLVNLMSDEVASNYNFTMYGAADDIVPLLVKGDLDAAAVPANLAATLYNKTNGAVEVACINTLGVLYIVENGETVNSVGDLKGQTIVTTGKGRQRRYHRVLQRGHRGPGQGPGGRSHHRHAASALRHQRHVPGRGSARCA